MIQQMTNLKRVNTFDWNHFVKVTKKRFRKKFKKTISTKEIKQIWYEWMQEKTNETVKGGEVKLDKHSSLEVIGTPILEDKIFGLLVKGKSMTRSGMLKVVDFNSRRKDYKYKIVYKNKLAKHPIYFSAHPDFSKQVNHGITNTNNYYKIECQ